MLGVSVHVLVEYGTATEIPLIGKLWTNSFSKAMPRSLTNQDRCYLKPRTANRILYHTSLFQCLKVQSPLPHGSTTDTHDHREFTELY